MAHQIQTQQKLQQQALQPTPAHIFLPSAPAGAPKSFEMTKRSVAAGNDERERLNQEMRAGQALFTEYGGVLGMTRAVLMQPAQLTGITEPLVPRIQADELRVRNAGVSLSEIYFMQQEQQVKKPALTAEVAQLMSALAGHPVQQTPLPQQVPPPTVLYSNKTSHLRN